MKTVYLKLAASVLSILLALTMIVGATFAWFTFSASPEIGGINIAIGGGRTILLAPDIKETVTVDGKTVTVHYPGEFSSTLNIADYEAYDYLKEVAGLSPVSTADGLYWLLPTYDEETGLINDVSQFQVDHKLANANVTDAQGGCYVCLDFWIVSPGSEFEIRVSADKTTKTGSYLLEIPAAETGTDEKLHLAEPQGIFESIARVGFLVNTEASGSETLSAYRLSEHWIKQYESLQGIYQEAGEKPVSDYRSTFTIYEPNGDKHPSEELSEGDYVITKPLDKNGQETDISDRLMIQETNGWKNLEQYFQAYIINKENLTADAAASGFYTEYVQRQYGNYVESGNFYKRTSAVYERAADGVVSKTALNGIMKAGAADDAVITTLTPNTPQRIRMYIWLEGQDVDCTNTSSIEGSAFALNLELSGADR